jgi:hypothetical protein
MSWPEDELERKTWTAAVAGRQFAHQMPGKPFAGFDSVAGEALRALEERLLPIMRKWAPVADVLQMVVDLHHADLPLPGGASISKAMDICSDDASTLSVGHMARHWGMFRNVAHILAAGALLARDVIEGDGSIFTAAWYAPDSVMAIAAGFESFGLSFRPHGQEDTLLPHKSIWRLPRHCVPQKPWLQHRTLSDRQRELSIAYKAKKIYIRNGA